MKKRFPVYIQHGAKDCGTTCLTMIADYYGRKLGQDNVADLCVVTRNGVSMSAIKKTAEKIGLRATGVALSIEELVEKKPLPCILYWSQRHFVVLYKISSDILKKDQKVFHVIDPSYGRVRFNISEIRQHWLNSKRHNMDVGILLCFEPTPDFYDLPNYMPNKRGYKLIKYYFDKYRSIFIQLVLGLFLGSCIQLIFPFFTQAIVDKGIGSRNLSFIYVILLAQAFLIFSRTVIELMRRWLLLHITVRMNLSLVSNFIGKLVKLPMRLFDTKRTGEILQRISDHENIQKFITTQSLRTLYSFFTLVVFSVILFYYNLKIFLIFVFGSLLYTFWITLFLKKRKLLNYKFFNKKSMNTNTTFQLVTSMQEIKLQGCADRKRSEWEDLQTELLDLQTEELKLDQYSEIGNILINESKNMVITIVAATSVISGEMTLGMMLAVQYIIGQLSSPIEDVVHFILSKQEMQISMDRVNEIYEKKNEVTPLHIIPADIPSGDIFLENVSFRYDETNNAYILKNISTTIHRGEITAIVGYSGSGKTTLIKLLLKYYDLNEGYIKVGNRNLADLNVEWWREQCGVVMQEGYIFSDTIARNIATGGDTINYEMLEYASKIANIFETIMALPLKYETFIGADGQGLSLGQKQRLLIARAVYRNPYFLFFDEATNSLDASNEKAIVENLSSYYKGRTVVIVAHRLSTVQSADKIIVLNDGRIVETGNHTSLMASKGHYYQLIKNQLPLSL